MGYIIVVLGVDSLDCFFDDDDEGKVVRVCVCFFFYPLFLSLWGWILFFAFLEDRIVVVVGK